MLSIVFIVIIIIFLFAFKFYGWNFLGRILQVDDSSKTPAHTMFDGIDYVPTRAPVLFGHHFSSIAGAGPIIGPVIVGIAFGWLPAILWIVIGSIFIGGVHDMSAIIASVRHKARSIAEIAREYISKLAYRLFLLFIWLDIIYVITVFADLTSTTFAQNGAVPTASFIYCILALIFGFSIYRKRISLLPATIVAVFFIFSGIWFGIEFPLIIPQSLNELVSAKGIWNIILLAYCFLASTLPVWILLQPRDYLSSYLLYSMLLAGTLGLLIGGFSFNYPAFLGYYSDYVGGMFPIVFITVACGAISGFHALIGSGTTSKQISKESDAVFIGYGSMLTEGLVAVIALATIIILAVDDPVTKKQPLEIFASGIGTFVTKFGIPSKVGATFGLLALSTFILTSLDTSTRISRYIFQEFFNLKKIWTRYPATIVSLILPLILLFVELKDPKGNPMPSWKAIWPVFGAANQLLAGLVLLVITVWLHKTKKQFLITLIPMLFMFIVTVWSLVVLVLQYGITVIGVIALCLLLLAIILAVSAVQTMVVKKITDLLKKKRFVIRYF